MAGWQVVKFDFLEDGRNMFMKFLFLALFVAVMIGVGIYSRKKINNEQDFYWVEEKWDRGFRLLPMVQHIFQRLFS